MKVGIPRETAARERRVAVTPEVVAQLVKRGLDLVVETEAGKRAFFSDADYEKAGASIASSAGEAFACDVVLKVEKTSAEEVQLLRQGGVVISFLYPQLNLDLVKAFASSGITSFSMDCVPRITRAQSMDALSSMSTIAGYKAVLRAASSLSRMMPMLVTAAGTLTPARVLVLGAGVAGLQAIATARRLGAVVEAFDVREAAREQVESLGARFVQSAPLDKDAEGAGGYAKELSQDAQARNLETIANALKNVDVVITTALIPGKPAPTLITEGMVRAMKPGAVIVDLAAERGGNCELTEAGKETIHQGVTVIGPLNLPSSAAADASQMYGKNITTFLLHLIDDDGKIEIDLKDEITAAMCITHNGDVVHTATRELLDPSTNEKESA